MRWYQNSFLVFYALLIPFCCWAGNKQGQKEKMIRELDIIQNSFDVKYAPAEWKKTFANWSIHDAITTAKMKVLASPNGMSIQQFQQVVKDIFKSTRDYHVGVHFFSTTCSMLPFSVGSAEGKYFITGVDSSELGEMKVGDEVISFNGMPIQQVVDGIKAREFGNLGSKTDQGLAEMFLTTRLGMLGHEVPSGAISIVLKKQQNGQTVNCDLTWSYFPEEVSNGPFLSFYREHTEASNKTAQSIQQLFNRPMQASFYEPLCAAWKRMSEEHPERDGGAHELGGRTSSIPILGEIVWQTSPQSAFHAYIFIDEHNRQIGYVRIPSFAGSAEKAKEFASIINMFEHHTEALIVDQVHNPGGSLFYMYALASMLTKDPLIVPKQRLTINQEEVFEAALFIKMMKNSEFKNPEEIKLEDTLQGYPITSAFVKGLEAHYTFIMNTWNSGTCFTIPYYFYGIGSLTSHPWGHYTGPILVLVNHMDFSCGDFFPAILQDNKRATIMGSQTAGAGGFVVRESHPNQFGIASYSLTGSIAERLDLKPIENLGIIPDILYEDTAEDLQFGYKRYAVEIKKVIDQMIKDNPPHRGENSPPIRQKSGEGR